MRILYLDIDSLRADHLGCYGYHRNTSPTIDSIANEGVRFDNYYCSDAPCLPSRTALMTGRFGIHTGVVGHGGTAADLRIQGINRGFRNWLDKESLPALFRSVGMKTILISPFAERHSAYHFYAGFNEMHNTGKGGIESAEEITPTALEWIRNNAKKDNWFLYINYWDPHAPYRAPMEFGNPFEKEPIPKWISNEVLEKHRNMVGPKGAREIAMFDNRVNPKYPRYPGEIKDMSDLKKMFDGYDCGVRYCDSHIEQLFSEFKKSGVFEDMVIVISADHAESMGELGIYSEHATADYGTCRIPLIIKWPGMKKGIVDKGFHYNIDLLPTYCELMKGESKPGWDGESFASILKNGKESGRDYLVLSQCAHVCQRSVRFSDYLYIRTYHDGYHLFPEEMLFNLKNDPNEEKDITKDNPDICKQAADYLNQWHDQMMNTMPEGYHTDPLQTVLEEGGPFHAKGYLKQYSEYLQQTGRGWAISDLKKRHPREFE